MNSVPFYVLFSDIRNPRIMRDDTDKIPYETPVRVLPGYFAGGEGREIYDPRAYLPAEAACVYAVDYRIFGIEDRIELTKNRYATSFDVCAWRKGWAVLREDGTDKLVEIRFDCCEFMVKASLKDDGCRLAFPTSYHGHSWSRNLEQKTVLGKKIFASSCGNCGINRLDCENYRGQAASVYAFISHKDVGRSRLSFI